VQGPGEEEEKKGGKEEVEANYFTIMQIKALKKF
jgi:hypothetical protein